jgi:PAS domain S-box-containing protein
LNAPISIGGVPESSGADALLSDAGTATLFEVCPIAMWVYDRESLAFLAVNDAALRLYGYSRDEFLGMTIRDIRPPEELPALARHLAEPRDAGATRIWKHRKKDGTPIEVEVVSRPFSYEGREAQLVISTDVTERRWLERQIQQVQKMEAIGRLAGGIAHDFNNLLTAILGYSDLLAARFAEGTREHEEVEEIRRAADRAAALTRHLLAFGRRQALEPVAVGVNDLVGGLAGRLSTVLGDRVELDFRLDAGAGFARIDPGQIEDVLASLAANARDAMPGGGRLTIATAGAHLDTDSVSGAVFVRPGPYVRISVRDTGIGMDAETQARIFEPFFTTKEKGRALGLGLATVYGIVKQSGGYIWVESEPGRGADFQIYLPRVSDGEALPAPTPPAAHPMTRGAETILLVEDEDLVRALTRRILEGLGYDVLEAADAEAALAHVRTHAGKIALVLSDVVMPGTDGLRLSAKIRALRPEVRVLYMSGYTDEAIAREGAFEPGTFFLQKPFTPFSLGKRIREVLGAAAT